MEILFSIMLTRYLVPELQIYNKALQAPGRAMSTAVSRLKVMQGCIIHGNLLWIFLYFLRNVQLEIMEINIH